MIIMRAKLRGAALLATTLALGCGERPADAASAEPVYERHAPLNVRVCVVNHAALPVSYTIIDPSISFAAAKLREHANITLEVTEKTSYEADADELIFGTETAVNPRSYCESPHDIALMFTGASNVLSVPQGSDMGNPLGGSDLEDRMSAIIYGRLQNHAQITLHEIGHLFGLEHSADKADILYEYIQQAQSYSSLEKLRHQSPEQIMPGDRSYISPRIRAGNAH